MSLTARGKVEGVGSVLVWLKVFVTARPAFDAPSGPSHRATPMTMVPATMSMILTFSSLRSRLKPAADSGMERPWYANPHPAHEGAVRVAPVVVSGEREVYDEVGEDHGDEQVKHERSFRVTLHN